MFSNAPLKLRVISTDRADTLHRQYGEERMSKRLSPSLGTIFHDWPSRMHEEKEPIIGSHPELPGVPMLSIPVGRGQFGRGFSDNRITGVRYMDLRLGEDAYFLCCSLYLNTQLLTVVFDAQENMTADALCQWSVLGYIPMSLRHCEHTFVEHLPFDANKAEFVREAAQRHVRYDDKRMSIALSVLAFPPPQVSPVVGDTGTLIAAVPSTEVVETMLMLEDFPIIEPDQD